MPGITKKDRPLNREHFAEFEKCYGADPNGAPSARHADSKEDRWRSFTIDEVKERDFKIDAQVAQGRIARRWRRSCEPEELATDAIAELESAVEGLNAVLTLLENGNSNGEVTAKPAKKA